MRARTTIFVLLLISFAAVARADTRADARRYFQTGMSLIEEGKFLQGVDLLKKAYTLRPHPSVLFNIARAYAAAGAVDQALEYFERYLDTDPSDADKVQATIADLKERKRLRNLVDEGMTAIDEGRHAEGISLLRRAYEARPHPNILYNIARAYEEARDYKHAIATYEKYLQGPSPRDEEEVKSTLKKLKGIMAKRATPPPQPAKRPTTVARAEPTPEQPKPGKGREKEPEGVPTVSPDKEIVNLQALDDAQLEKLAQMIAQMVRRDSPGSLQPLADSAARGGEGSAELTPVALDEGETGGSSPAGGGIAGGPSRRAGSADTRSSTAAIATDVALEAKSGEAYEEVVVTASRREQSPLDAPNAVTIITDEDIRLSGARTIPDLLRRVPGMDVMAMSYSDYNVAMRGFNRRVANKILVLIDGRTAYEDFLGGTLWRSLTIDLRDISRIEVVRGPGSAIYGAYAYTGTVNIITKRPEEVGGSLAHAAAGNGKTVEATYQYGERRGPFGVRASVSYVRADKYELEFDPSRVDYSTNVEDPMRSLENTRFDATAEYNFKGDAGRIFIGGGALSGFQELYGVAALRNQAIDMQSYNIRGGYSGKLFSLLAFWNELRAISTPQFYRTGLDDLGSTLRADIISVEPVFRPTLTFLGEHSFVFGGEYRHKYIQWEYLDNPHEEDHFAVFAQDAWTISKSFSAIGSFRLDLHPIIGALASPRVALIYKPTPRQALRASFGTAFRQPTQAETYLDLAASTPTAGVAVTLKGGQDRLKPENITTLDVGYLVQPDFGELEVVGYVNRVGDLISRTRLEFDPRGGTYDPEIGAYIAAVSNYYNDTRHLLALGTEISTRLYPVEGVDVGASYAFQYIFNEDTGDRFTDSPLHKATLWGQLRTSIGMDIGASVHFVSSQDWVEPSYDPTSATGFNADPLPVPASVLIIGRIGYRLLEDKLELAISGTNLSDFGSLRHREHPFANHLEARVVGSITARF